jgi:hypothetical protein
MSIISLEREIAKTEEKVELYREKIRTLKQRKLEEENAQIIKLVRSFNVSIADLKEMFTPVKEEKDV